MANENVIEIVVRAIDEVSKIFKGIEANVAATNKTLASGFGSAASAMSGFVGTVKLVTGAIASLTIVREVVEVFNRVVEESAAAQDSLARLTVSVRNFAATAGVTRKYIDDFSESLQRVSGFSSEAADEAQASLLRFTSVVGGNFNRARGMLADLALVMHADLPTAAYVLGRALENPDMAMRSLRQAGIVLTRDQQELLKALGDTGDVLGQQGLILDIVGEKTRGVSDELSKGFNESLKQLKNVIADLFKQPDSLDGMATAFRGMADAIRESGLRELIGDIAKSMKFVTEWGGAGFGHDIKFLTGAANLARDAAKNPHGVIGEVQDRAKGMRSIGDTSWLDAALRDSTVFNPSDASKLAAANVRAATDQAFMRGSEEADRLRAAYDQADEHAAERAAAEAKKFAQFLDDITKESLAAADKLTEQTLKSIGGISEPLKNLGDQIKAQSDAYWSGKEAEVKRADQLSKGYVDAVSSFTTAYDAAAIKLLNARAAIVAYMSQPLSPERLREAQADLDRVTAEGNKRLQEIKDSTDEMAQFAQKAAHEVQSSFTDAFMNLDKGANNFLATMLNAFKRILAEAMAMDLEKALGLDKIFKGGGSGDGTYSGAVLGMFGGAIKRGFGALFGGGGTGERATKDVAVEDVLKITTGDIAKSIDESSQGLNLAAVDLSSSGEKLGSAGEKLDVVSLALQTAATMLQTSGSGGGGGGLGGLLGGLFGSMGGGAGGGNPWSGGMDVGEYAGGGITGGGLSLFGEEGPELGIVPAGTRILNRRQLAFAGRRGRGEMAFIYAPVTHNHGLGMSAEEVQAMTAYQLENQKREIYRQLRRNRLGDIR